MDRTNIEDAKVPVKEFTLPRGFLLADEGETFVLNRAEVREMTGYEEDIIANDNVSFSKRMHDLVGNCLVSLSDGDGHSIIDSKRLKRISGQLLMSDLMVAIFRIREATVGSEIRQRVRCPECTNDEGKPYTWTAILNLSDFVGLPVKGDPLANVREFTTSRQNKVTWEMMTGEMELQSGKIKNARERATNALLIRVKSFNEETDYKKIKESLKRLSAVERQEIRRQFDSEGGIETDFECVCRNCGHEFMTTLEIGGAQFFSPFVESSD